MAASPVLDIGGGRTGAPTRVTTAVVVIGFLANKLGSLPRRVVERGDRTGRPIMDRKYRMLWGPPNVSEPGVPFWVRMWAHLEGWSNAFVFRRTMGSLTVGLDLLHPAQVDVDRLASGEPRYTYRVGDGREYVYGRDEVIHIMRLSWDGLRGVPPVTAATTAHQISGLQDRWQQNFYRRWAAPSGVVSSPSDMDDGAVDEFYEAWDEQHAGAAGAGGVVLVQGGVTYTPILPPSDEGMLQARNLTREDILGVYAPGLPHHVVGWRSNTSNWGTGVEQQGIHLVQHVFDPRHDLVSDVMSWALLPEDLKLDWDTSQWLRGDAKSRAEVLAKERQAGALTREEYRHETGRPRLVGVPDDVWKPQNMESLPVVSEPS